MNNRRRSYVTLDIEAKIKLSGRFNLQVTYPRSPFHPYRVFVNLTFLNPPCLPRRRDGLAAVRFLLHSVQEANHADRSR